MREWTVKSGEKDQRFNKYLQRRLPGAPSSFLYKMLRKKNITLNGKKASGSELLLEGDLVTLFLSRSGAAGVYQGIQADSREDWRRRHPLRGSGYPHCQKTCRNPVPESFRHRPDHE